MLKSRKENGKEETSYDGRPDGRYIGNQLWIGVVTGTLVQKASRRPKSIERVI